MSGATVSASGAEDPLSCPCLFITYLYYIILMATSHRQNSLLTRKFMTNVLSIAKTNLERENRLVAMLFVQGGVGSGGDTVTVVPLSDLPGDAVQRHLYLLNWGSRLRRELGEITEAVYLGETWWVPTPVQDIGKVAPSAHPDRQEVVLLVGRNATNTRQSVLLQPFTRDRLHTPVWGDTPFETYGHSGDLRFLGLLDKLFEGNQGKVPRA